MAECLFYELSGCGFENRYSQYNMVSINFSKQQKLKILLSFPSRKLKKNIPWTPYSFKYFSLPSHIITSNNCHKKYQKAIKRKNEKKQEN